jgi:hypothetical protein
VINTEASQRICCNCEVWVLFPFNFCHAESVLHARPELATSFTFGTAHNYTVEFEIGFSSEQSMIIESTHIFIITTTIMASCPSTLH